MSKQLATTVLPRPQLRFFSVKRASFRPRKACEIDAAIGIVDFCFRGEAYVRFTVDVGKECIVASSVCCAMWRMRRACRGVVCVHRGGRKRGERAQSCNSQGDCLCTANNNKSRHHASYDILRFGVSSSVTVGLTLFPPRKFACTRTLVVVSKSVSVA